MAEKLFVDFGESPEKSSDRGFMPSLRRGLRTGVAGLIAGNKPEAAPEDASWTEQAGGMLGKFVSDWPAMIPGAEAGALAGGSVGSLIPGIGTGIGGLVGAGAGAMALPTAIDSAFEEYHNFSKNGGEGSFGDYLNAVGRTAKETGKQALLGGATGIVSKALPVLRKIPMFEKLLSTNLGRQGVSKGLEYGTFTLGQAALEGRTPTMQEAVNNALLIGGIHAASGAAGMIRGRGTPEIVSKVGAKLGEFIPEPIKAIGKDIQGYRQSTNEKMYFELLKNHIGESNAKTVASQFKWRDSLNKSQEKGAFTPRNLEEMMYYRQKTGNPGLKGDTLEALESRLPEHAKDFVNNVVGPHLEESLRTYNEHPLTRNINPREALTDIYLPGLYEKPKDGFGHTHDEISKQFKTANPLAKSKTFMTYMDAAQAKGLIPRYKNIVDLMRSYDQINTKIISNLEFLDQIKKTEKTFSENGELGKVNKLIVNSSNRKAYEQAKRESYVPFDDVFLRRYVSATKEPSATEKFMGKFKERKPVFATTAAPALVHPDLAPAVQGVFRKEPYRDASSAAKAYDALSNELRAIHVAGSLFHYGSLFTHTGGLLGAKKAFASIAPWYTDFKAKADMRLNNKEFMMDAARSGLTVHKRIEGLGEQGSLIGKALNKAAEKLPEGVRNSEFVNKTADTLERGMKHLFEVHHPRLKINAWADMVEDYAKGKNLGENEMKEVKREMAKVVNNVFGGQQWETLRHLNNPENMKFFRRVIAYPDWTLSAIRAADVGLTKTPSIAQQQARKFWLKYGLFLGGLHGFMKWFYGGLKQTDPDESASGIRFDPIQGFKALDVTEGDPKNWYKIKLPDIPVKILGETYNPGKDEKGRSRYAQMMKSALELGGWASHPFVEFFRKSNPLIQATWKQVMDSTPTDDGTYAVQGVWKSGKQEPWGGTKPNTMARGVARVKEAVGEFTPFSLSTVGREGFAPFVASGLGAASVSKGMSLHDSEKYFEKYLSAGDMDKVNNLKSVLTENGYKSKSIKATISRVKNRLKKD